MKMIFFDLDGTLIDSRQDLANAVNHVRLSHNLTTLTTAEVTSMLGDGLRNLMRRAIPGITDKDDSLNQACLDMNEFYKQHLVDNTRLFPGVIDTMRILSKRRNLAVVTNKQDDAAHLILEKLGVSPFLSAIIGGNKSTKIKPDPEALFLAAKACNSQITGAWMVGDHRTDLGAAENAGIYACFCSFGFGIQDNKRADAVISQFNLLTQIIR